MRAKALQLVLCGVSWRLLQPLIDHQLMPALAGLLQRGSPGPLLASAPQLPLQLEHAILSGAPPHAHGLVQPLRADGGRVTAYTDVNAATPSLVDHLHAAGVPAIWLGWPHLQPREHGDSALIPRLMIRPGQWDAGFSLPLASLRVSAEQIGIDHLRPFFVDLDDDAILGDPATPILQAALAEAGTLQAMLTWWLQKRAWRFASMRISLVDAIVAYFGDCHPPLAEDADPLRVLRYQYLVTGALRFVDLLLQRLLKLVGPDCVVCVHSEQGRGRPPQALPADAPVHLRHRSDHDPRGFMLLAGPAVRPQSTLWAAELVDIAPTLLTLLGFAPAAGMSGRVMREAMLDPEAPLLPLPEVIERPAPNADFAAALAAEREALGEVPPLSTLDAQELADESTLLLALSLLQSGEATDALPLLVELSERRPQWRRCVLHRARCHLSLGQDQAAQTWIERFLELGEPDLRSHLLLGQIRLQRGEHQRALMHFFEAEQLRPEDPISHCQIGDAYRRAEQLDRAKDAFQRALHFDPECAHAWLGLAKLALQADDNAAAVEHCMSALQHQFRLPEAHYHLGVALARSGEIAPAINAFELSLSMAPRLVAAHQWLARLYRLVSDGTQRAAEHELAARRLS